MNKIGWKKAKMTSISRSP